jgi:hypothetical protein
MVINSPVTEIFKFPGGIWYGLAMKPAEWAKEWNPEVKELLASYDGKQWFSLNTNKGGWKGAQKGLIFPVYSTSNLIYGLVNWDGSTIFKIMDANEPFSESFNMDKDEAFELIAVSEQEENALQVLKQKTEIQNQMAAASAGQKPAIPTWLLVGGLGLGAYFFLKK